MNRCNISYPSFSHTVCVPQSKNARIRTVSFPIFVNPHAQICLRSERGFVRAHLRACFKSRDFDFCFSALGQSLVEFVLTLPILLGIIIGSQNIFYQEWIIFRCHHIIFEKAHALRIGSRDPYPRIMAEVSGESRISEISGRINSKDSWISAIMKCGRDSIPITIDLPDFENTGW